MGEHKRELNNHAVVYGRYGMLEIGQSCDLIMKDVVCAGCSAPLDHGKASDDQQITTGRVVTGSSRQPLVLGKIHTSLGQRI